MGKLHKLHSGYIQAEENTENERENVVTQFLAGKYMERYKKKSSYVMTRMNSLCYRGSHWGQCEGLDVNIIFGTKKRKRVVTSVLGGKKYYNVAMYEYKKRRLFDKYAFFSLKWVWGWLACKNVASTGKVSFPKLR